MKEDRKMYMKAYREKNRDRIRASNKAYRDSKKDGLFAVYYLPEEHYVGMTECIDSMMRVHKNRGKHTLDVELVAKFETKREALACESYMHSIGYNGSNPFLYQKE